MRIRRAFTLGAAAAGLVAGTIALAPAASAAATPTSCPDDGQSLCVYENNNYGGQMHRFDAGAQCRGDGSPRPCQWVSGFKVNLSSVGFGDRVSPIANHSHVRINCYRDANEQGPSFFPASGWIFDTVGLNNDSFSSCASLDDQVDRNRPMAPPRGGAIGFERVSRCR